MNVKNEIIVLLQEVKSTLDVPYAQFISEGISPEELRSIIKELEEENLIEIIEQNDFQHDNFQMIHLFEKLFHR